MTIQKVCTEIGRVLARDIISVLKVGAGRGRECKWRAIFQIFRRAAFVSSTSTQIAPSCRDKINGPYGILISDRKSKLNSLPYRQCLHWYYESFQPFQLKIIVSKTSTGFRCPRLL